MPKPSSPFYPSKSEPNYHLNSVQNNTSWRLCFLEFDLFNCLEDGVFSVLVFIPCFPQQFSSIWIYFLSSFEFYQGLCSIVFFRAEKSSLKNVVNFARHPGAILLTFRHPGVWLDHGLFPIKKKTSHMSAFQPQNFMGVRKEQQILRSNGQCCLVTPDCLGMGKNHVLQQNRINKLNMGEDLFLFPLETWKPMGLSGPLDEILLLWIA